MVSQLERDATADREVGAGGADLYDHRFGSEQKSQNQAAHQQCRGDNARQGFDSETSAGNGLAQGDKGCRLDSLRLLSMFGHEIGSLQITTPG